MLLDMDEKLVFNPTVENLAASKALQQDEFAQAIDSGSQPDTTDCFPLFFATRRHHSKTLNGSQNMLSYEMMISSLLFAHAPVV